MATNAGAHNPTLEKQSDSLAAAPELSEVEERAPDTWQSPENDTKADNPDEESASKEAADKRRRKYLALFVLMFQSSTLILTMGFSRMGDSDKKYFASTAVLLNEILKVIICFIKSVYDVGLRETSREVFRQGHWKLAVPAALYTLQNNLQYVAASCLTAATFQVTYQLKILTTAFFAVTILHKQLKGRQWLALMILTAGVGVVQLPQDFWAPSGSKKKAKEESPFDAQLAQTQMIGLAAVTCACVLSGLAGIYFEKVLKRTKNVSLWVRNIQLSFYSLFPALFLGVLAHDGAKIAEKGFFYGYNNVVIAVIWLQALGGILVALCVKYADNIAKNFATSLSILISTVVSAIIYHTPVTGGFVVGATMVVGSTFWFSANES